MAKHRWDRHKRFTVGVAYASCILTALLTVLVVVSVPAIPAAAASASRLPLLLVHGYQDDCHDAFNFKSQAYAASYDTETLTYLHNNGFTNSDTRTVGYYSGTWTAGRDNGTSDTGTDATCDVNVQNQSSDVLSKCGGTSYYYVNDPIEHLACLFAWYVYGVNRGSDTAVGTAVDVLAHSMGGLIVRAAEYYTSFVGTDGPYTFPPAALYIRRVVTVGTPHDGLQGAFAWFYNQTNIFGQNLSSREVSDMTVCPNYQDSCTLNYVVDVGGGQPVTLSTSPLMKRLHLGGKPFGASGTYWALIGSSVQCNPIDGRTMPTCLLGRKAVNVDPYTGSDFVVQSDSMMAMSADYKIMYGEVEKYNGGLFPDVYHSGGPSYDHEANTCAILSSSPKVCATAPYYLNDGRSGTTKAWVCSSACNGGITDVPFSGDTSTTSTVPYSLAEIVSLLPMPPPLPESSLVIRSTANANYVSAELGYSGGSYGELRARAATQGSWESWTKVALTSGLYALRSNANGLYVSAELGYSGAQVGELRARSTSIGAWEVFAIVSNSDGTYSLVSMANGKYVSAELGYTGPDYGMLRARASSPGSWEKFTQNTGSLSCTTYPQRMNGPNSCGGFSTHSGWFSGGGVGLYGQEIWTYGNGTVQDSTATYQLSGLDTTHVWELDAYIPNCCSDASHAHYHYCSPGGGCADGYVNQNNYTNQWANFGAVCTTDGTASIVLADDGGDVYPAAVGADAIRAVRLSFLC